MGIRGLNDIQMGWAGRIVARVKSRFPNAEGRQLAKRALMTALTESALYMYANVHNAESLKYHYDKKGSDHGSVGLYQQQVGGAPYSTANWGTTAQLMDVNVSTDKFVDALRRIDWRSMTAGQACQRVQVSAFPDRYAFYAAWGDDLVAHFWDGAKVAPVPVVGRNITSRPTRDIQALVGAKPDGIYGVDTTVKVKKWQKAHGLEDDGIWGPKSDAKGFPKKPSKPSKPKKLKEDGLLGSATIRRWQEVLGTPADGRIDNPSVLVREVQTILNKRGRKGLNGKKLTVDGRGIGPNIVTAAGPTNTIHALQEEFGMKARDGILSKGGSPTVKVLQKRLNAGKF